MCHKTMYRINGLSVQLTERSVTLSYFSLLVTGNCFVCLHVLINDFFIPCRHVLFTPQRYHVATNESFSLTSYDYDFSHAVATVSYEECTCRNGRRTCDKKRDGIFSQSRGMTRRGTSNQNQAKGSLIYCVLCSPNFHSIINFSPSPAIFACIVVTFEGYTNFH